MKALYTIIIVLLVLASCQAQIPDKEMQIAAALHAAPEEKRDNATVMGYDAKGKLMVLREGGNEMICIADDPSKEGFSVVAYHKDLADFMERGIVLRAEGKKPGEIDDIREKEVKSGKLQMPDGPRTLHVLSGPNAYFDKENAVVKEANLRYVIYIPYATQESTGLPIRPLVPGGAWIMDPGTHKAHIMVTPPAN